MSVSASHDDGMDHRGPDDVVNVTPTTDQETRIFEAFERRADGFHERRYRFT